jgi:hypothetical protein
VAWEQLFQKLSDCPHNVHVGKHVSSPKPNIGSNRLQESEKGVDCIKQTFPLATSTSRRASVSVPDSRLHKRSNGITITFFNKCIASEKAC